MNRSKSVPRTGGSASVGVRSKPSEQAAHAVPPLCGVHSSADGSVFQGSPELHTRYTQLEEAVAKQCDQITALNAENERLKAQLYTAQGSVVECKQCVEVNSSCQNDSGMEQQRGIYQREGKRQQW